MARKRKGKKKKKKLNVKVAVIGMIVLMGLLIGAVVVVRGRKGDPLKLVSEAEAALAEIEGQLAQYSKIVAASGAESEEAELMLEAGETAYSDAGRFFGEAIGATDDDQLKIDIFFKLVDYYAEDNAFHEGEWPKVYGCWNGILNIDPKNVKAMKAQLENLYQIADYGSNNSWSAIEANASDLLDIMKEKSIEPDPYVLKAKGRALLEMASLGQAPDLQDAIEDAEVALNALLDITPYDADVYEYLARAAETRGEIEVAAGSRNAAIRAMSQSRDIRQNAIEATGNNATAHINYLEMKRRQAGRDMAKRASLEGDYQALAQKFVVDAEVYLTLAEYYSGDVRKTDEAIDAIGEAMELDPENVEYATKAAYLYYRKYSIFGDKDSLAKAMQIAEDALSLPNSQLVKGPRRDVNTKNRYTLYSILSAWYVELAVEAQQSGDDLQHENWVAKAEESIYQIEQIRGTSDNVYVVMWHGMLSYAKGDRTEAVRQLYDAYSQFKATEKADAILSYTLAKLFEGRAELGSRMEFLTSAIYDAVRAGRSIVVSKPEVMLEYAEVLLERNRFTWAVSLADAYENLYPANERSRSIRVKGYISTEMYDEAEDVLAEMDQRSGEIIALRISLVQKHITLSVQSADEQEFALQKGSDTEDTSLTEADLAQYRKERIELTEKLLNEKPELVKLPMIFRICNEDYIKNGKVNDAQDLIAKFLAHNPDNANARGYQLMLMEPDPENIAAQRKDEISELVLKDIPDQVERAIALSAHYQKVGQLDKAVDVLKEARAASPSDKQIAGTLFGLYLAKNELELAAELAKLAQSEDLDECNGDYFGARLDIANEEYQSAIARLDKCLEIHPIFSYAYFLKSQVYTTLENHDEAIDNAKIAAKINPKALAIARQYASVLFARHDRSGGTFSAEEFTETENALLMAISLDQNDWLLRGTYADFIKDRDPDKAMSMLQGLQKYRPNLENSLVLGNIAVRIAKKEQNAQRKQALFAIAGSAYQKALAIDNGNQKVLTAYSELLRITGRQKEVEAMFASSDESLWRFHYRDGQYVKAKDILRKLYRENSEDVAIIKGLTLVAQKTSDKSALKSYSEKLLELDLSVDNELLQIQSYLETGLVNEANLKLASFRERNPEESRGVLLEAWANMSMGNLQKSLDLINISLETDSNNATAWRLRGQTNSLLGYFNEAVENFQKGKSIDSDPAIRIELAKAYNRAGRTKDAIGELVMALKEGQAPLSARTMLERLYRQTGRKSNLKAFYQENIEKFPEDHLWYFRAGGFYLEGKEYDQAEKLFEKAWQLSQKDGGDAEILNQYLETLRLGGKYQDLLSYASKYIDTPVAPIAYGQMAQTEVELKNTPAAIGHYHKAIDKSTSNPASLSDLLDKMSKTVGSDEVEKYCDQRLKANPDSLIANLAMFNHSQQTGQYNRALQHVDKLLEIVGPDDPSWFIYTDRRSDTLIMAYMKTSNDQYSSQAIKAYEDILVKRPNNVNALNNLAYLLAETDEQLDKAAEYARRACRVAPNSASNMDTYAYILCKTYEYEQASRLLLTAIQLSERESMGVTWDIYRHLGMAQEGLGEDSKAASSYKKALQLGGDIISKKNKKELTDSIRRVSL